jgi:hypothetical protein
MDTIMIVRDTIAIKLNEMTDFYQPYVEKNGTNWFDVTIAILICLSVFGIVVYGIYKYYEDKAKEREFQAKVKEAEKTNVPNLFSKPEKSPEEKKIEAELKRQSRNYDLMKEICELSRDPGTSKDVKGKYNNTEAEKLWKLYKEIDSYNKDE